MDPNIVLENLRQAIHDYYRLAKTCCDDGMAVAAEAAIEAAESLDNWLRSDGFLPTEWNK